MKHYIIDGNNLIGKIKSFNQLQKKNKQQCREKLAFLLSRYFSKKKQLLVFILMVFKVMQLKFPVLKYFIPEVSPQMKK
jgi:predicted RNA-binding protein with PIN domain